MEFQNSGSAHLDFKAEVPYLVFPVLSGISFIKHGFSTRLGGVSQGIFSTMNLGSESSGYHDDPDHIMENYLRITSSIGIDPHTIVVSKQVHKTDIRRVDENDRGKGLYLPTDYDEIDGLVTDRPEVTLVTKYADCVPLFFVDTKRRAIGLSHAGWRGTAAKIGLVTVQTMQRQFGSNPADIISVIGPSICKECYEIGEDTAEEFRHAFPINGEPNDNKILTVNSTGRYQCDLWEANRYVLSEAGLLPEHIHISGVCTSCNSDILFSHRKTGGKRGSLAAFLMIKSEGIGV